MTDPLQPIGPTQALRDLQSPGPQQTFSQPLPFYQPPNFAQPPQQPQALPFAKVNWSPDSFATPPTDASGNPLLQSATDLYQGSGLNSFLTGQPGSEPPGGFVHPFGIPIATTPITATNLATYGREGLISLLTAAMGEDYRPQVDPATGQVMEPKPVDPLVGAFQAFGDTLMKPLDAFNTWRRQTDSFNRGKEIRNLIATGTAFDNGQSYQGRVQQTLAAGPAAPILAGNGLIDLVTSAIFGGSEKFTYSSLLEAAKAKGIADPVKALSTYYDLAPEVVAAIMANPQMTDDELGKLTDTQTSSLNPLVNIGYELGSTVAGIAIAGRVAGPIAAAVAPELAGTRAAQLAGAAAKLYAANAAAGWTIRGAEWGIKEVAGLLGNKGVADTMDRLLWQMPLSMNPGLNLVDAFTSHPMQAIGITGTFRPTGKGLLAGEVTLGHPGGLSDIGTFRLSDASLRDSTTGAVKVAGGERVASPSAPNPEARPTGSFDENGNMIWTVGGRPIALNLGPEVRFREFWDRFQNMTLDDLQPMLDKMGWTRQMTETAVGEGNKFGLTLQDFKNGLIYAAMNTARDARGPLARLVGTHLPDAVSRGEYFVRTNAREGLNILRDNIEGRSDSIPKAFTEQFWQLDKLNDTHIGDMKRQLSDTYDPISGLADFAAWIGASKTVNEGIAARILRSDTVPVLRKDINEAAIQTFRDHFLSQYAPDQVVPRETIDWLKRNGGFVEGYGEGSKLVRRGYRDLTRTKLEKVLESVVNDFRSRMKDDSRDPQALYSSTQAGPGADLTADARVLNVSPDAVKLIEEMIALPPDQRTAVMPADLLERVSKDMAVLPEDMATNPQMAWQKAIEWHDAKLAKVQLDTATYNAMRDAQRAFEARAQEGRLDPVLAQQAHDGLQTAMDELTNPLDPTKIEGSARERYQAAQTEAEAFGKRLQSHLDSPLGKLRLAEHNPTAPSEAALRAEFNQGALYHGTTKGTGAQIEANGFDAARFNSRLKGPAGQVHDYPGVYLTADAEKATNYYSTSADVPTNDVLGGGDVIRVRVDRSKFVPRSEWKKITSEARAKATRPADEINAEIAQLQDTLAKNGPDWENAQMFRDWIARDQAELANPIDPPAEAVRIAQERGYTGVETRGGQEVIVFNPKDAITFPQWLKMRPQEPASHVYVLPRGYSAETLLQLERTAENTTGVTPADTALLSDPSVHPLLKVEALNRASGPSYPPNTEMVPVSFLAKLPPFNRIGKTDVGALAEDIRANGIQDPLILTYYKGDRTVVLGEGNHRLAAAKRLGLESLPVRVVRSEGNGGAKGVKVSGIEPNEYGYIPGDLRPSQVGIEATPTHGTIDTSAFPNPDEIVRAMLTETDSAGLADLTARAISYAEQGANLAGEAAAVGQSFKTVWGKPSAALQSVYDRGALWTGANDQEWTYIPLSQRTAITAQERARVARMPEGPAKEHAQNAANIMEMAPTAYELSPESTAIWQRFMGTPHPESLGAAADAVWSLDQGVTKGLSPADAEQLHADLVNLIHRKLAETGTQPHAPTLGLSQARLDDPMVLPSALRELAHRLQDRIDTADNPLDGWETTRYDFGNLPARGVDGTLLPPRLQLQDWMTEWQNLNNIVPSLGDEFMVGRSRLWADRMRDLRKSHHFLGENAVGNALRLVNDKVLGSRTESQMHRDTQANFANLLGAPDADAIRFLRGWEDYVRSQMLETTVPVSNMPVFRRVGLVDNGRLNRWSAEYTKEVLGPVPSPKWQWWTDALKNGDIAETWHKADNRVRNSIIQGADNLASAMEGVLPSVAKFTREHADALYGAGISRDLAKAGRGITVLYHMLRFAFDPRFLAMEYMDSPFLYVSREGLDGLPNILSATKGFKKLIGEQVEPDVLFGHQQLMDTYYNWMATGEPGLLIATRRRSVLNAVSKGQIREMTAEYKRFAMEHADIRQALQREHDTPESYIRKVDQNVMLEMERGKWIGADAVGEKLQPFLDRGTITPQEFADLKASGIYVEHPAIDREMAKFTTPAELLLLERLHVINNQVWSDVTRLFFGQPDRSNLQRMLNHPLLFWPLSYQIKATKWLASVLTERALGHDTGLGGLYAYGRLVDAHRHKLQTDPEYAQFFKDNSELLFFAGMFLPITPDDMGVSMSPWTHMVLDHNYNRNIFSVGPFYTTQVLLPNLIREQSKPYSLTQTLGPGPIPGLVSGLQQNFPYMTPVKPTTFHGVQPQIGAGGAPGTPEPPPANRYP